jgi:DNA-binding NarL/FixJ family response regulator
MDEQNPIRVAIVEDNTEFRNTIVSLLGISAGFTLAAACAQTEEALSVLPEAKPDVVLVDVNLPGRSGIACVAELRDRLPEAALLMLTIEQNSRKLIDSIEAGADGYLVKTTPSLRLLECIQEAHAGGSPLSSGMARMLVQRFRSKEIVHQPERKLSGREEQILKLLASGLRAKEVSEQIDLSVHTVRAVVRTIYRKLQARSVPEAVAKFMGPKKQ